MTLMSLGIFQNNYMSFLNPTLELAVIGYELQNSTAFSYDKLRFITTGFLRGFLKNLYAVYVSYIELFVIYFNSKTIARLKIISNQEIVDNDIPSRRQSYLLRHWQLLELSAQEVFFCQRVIINSIIISI